MRISQAIAVLSVLAGLAAALPKLHPPKDPYVDMDPKHVGFNSKEFWEQYENVFWDGKATKRSSDALPEVQDGEATASVEEEE